MKPVTLVTNRLYCGLDATQLRNAAGRVISRLEGVAEEVATIRLDALVEDFRVSAAASRTMVERMVRAGFLRPVANGAVEYALTDKFRLCAHAQIVEPMPRSRAKMLLDHVVEVAQDFNRTASNNKYEIERIAVHGTYMTRAPMLPEVALGITGRRRHAVAPPVAGRATVPVEGRQRIRTMFETQSAYLEIEFFRRQEDVPRPFSVIFKADA